MDKSLGDRRNLLPAGHPISGSLDTIDDSERWEKTSILQIISRSSKCGALCPKGAGVLDFVNSPNRLAYPEYRAPGSDKWERISWHEAIHKAATWLKKDRDANWEATNEEGTPVNRWTTTGFLAASAASNETALITQKFGRAFGMLVLDNQAST